MSSDDPLYIAVQALTEIQSHAKACETRYDETTDTLREINRKLDILRVDVSEAQGAAKLGKWLIGGVGAITGAIGGISSHLVWK